MCYGRAMEGKSIVHKMESLSIRVGAGWSLFLEAEIPREASIRVALTDHRAKTLFEAFEGRERISVVGDPGEWFVIGQQWTAGGAVYDLIESAPRPGWSEVLPPRIVVSPWGFSVAV